MRAGVEPGEAAREKLHVQQSAPKIFAIHVGDLQLAAGRGSQIGGDVDHLVVIEVQPVTASLDFGAAGFSSIDTGRPAASSSTTPYRSGSFTG